MRKNIAAEIAKPKKAVDTPFNYSKEENEK